MSQYRGAEPLIHIICKYVHKMFAEQSLSGSTGSVSGWFQTSALHHCSHISEDHFRTCLPGGGRGGAVGGVSVELTIPWVNSEHIHSTSTITQGPMCKEYICISKKETPNCPEIWLEYW